MSRGQKAAGETLSLLFAEAANDPSKTAYKSFNRRVPSPPVFIPDGRARARLLTFFSPTINLGPRRREREIRYLVIELGGECFSRGGLSPNASSYTLISRDADVLAVYKSRNGDVFSSLMPTSPMDQNIDRAE